MYWIVNFALNFEKYLGRKLKNFDEKKLLDLICACTIFTRVTL